MTAEPALSPSPATTKPPAPPATPAGPAALAAPAIPAAPAAPAKVTPRGRIRALAHRVDAATPEHRDRAVDALRAYAILGVVLGHWLVTALVASAGPDGGRAWSTRSPLASLPALAPVSWSLQTLALFFFVGGYSAARSLRRPRSAAGWVRARVVRLCRPPAVLVAAWAPLTLLLAATGTDPMPLVRLMYSPLWFLCVFIGLTALTPLLVRCGPYAAAVAAAVVGGVDLVRFGLDGPARLGWLNVPAAWAVPYLLGVAWANGRLGSRRTALALLFGGAAVAVALVAFAGYPASMVGVPGARVSNLSPPTAAAMAFGLAQVGAALLLRDRLARWMRRPLAWAPVALANLSAMTLFCWHQTSFMLVTSAMRPFGRLPGLHDVPDHWGWVAARVAWLPAFASVLAGCLAVFRRFEGSSVRPGRRRCRRHG